MTDETERPERTSTPKQMMADFRTWHVWHHEKAVYREVYTRTLSALLVAVIGYFFVALGTSLKFDPIAYLAWTVGGIAFIIFVYTLGARLLRFLKQRFTTARARRRGTEGLKSPARNKAQYEREANRLAVTSAVAGISGVLVALLSFLQQFVFPGK